MAEQITNYKCPACTGPLKFSSLLGKLECEYCGSTFTTEEIKALNEQKDEKAAEAFNEENEKEAQKEEKVSWDASNEEANQNKETLTMKSYSCPSCGAEIICEQTTAATSCPYCGNPSIVPGQMTGTLKPDYIIPFKLDKNHAKNSLMQYYQKKRFLPKEFSTQNQIDKIQGIYVPFWFFDGIADGEASYQGSNSSSHRSGDYIITSTKHYSIKRAGTVEFKNIPADASKKMPDDLMDSIEPFNYSELTDFSTAYLPGYLADKYDVTMEESTERACSRARNSLSMLLRSTVSGYSSTTETGSHIDIKNLKSHYAFLPVWLIHTKWQNQDFLFAMNGQTGKFIGNLPACPKKLRLLFWGLTIGIGAVLYFTGISGFFVKFAQAALL